VRRHDLARDAGRRGASWSGKLRPFVERRVSGPDVDDVLQDVFVRMQRGLAGLRDEDRFGPWVYQVARSAILDHQRGGPRAVADVDATERARAGRARRRLAEDDGAVERELAAYVAPFVAMLPSPYREALTLTELEGLTQKDAAAMLGVSLSGMKSRVQRGRRAAPRDVQGVLRDHRRPARPGDRLREAPRLEAARRLLLVRSDSRATASPTHGRCGWSRCGCSRRPAPDYFSRLGFAPVDRARRAGVAATQRRVRGGVPRVRGLYAPARSTASRLRLRPRRGNSRNKCSLVRQGPCVVGESPHRRALTGGTPVLILARDLGSGGVVRGARALCRRLHP
jgi:RNA polymerase sigma-70 factor (ECF subfamily)